MFSMRDKRWSNCHVNSFRNELLDSWRPDLFEGRNLSWASKEMEFPRKVTEAVLHESHKFQCWKVLHSPIAAMWMFFGPVSSGKFYFRFLHLNDTFPNIILSGMLPFATRLPLMADIEVVRVDA